MLTMSTSTLEFYGHFRFQTFFWQKKKIKNMPCDSGKDSSRKVKQQEGHYPVRRHPKDVSGQVGVLAVATFWWRERKD